MIGSASHLLRALERIAALVGVACLLWFGLGVGHAAIANRAQRGLLEQQLASSDAGAVAAPDHDTGVLGLLEIPRLEFSELVLEGDDDATLSVAIGHLPDTPMPWQPGNSAFAGHRDGRFRPLKDIRAGDLLRLVTRRGTFVYELRETVIVEPDAVWVLDPTSSRTLTLITCYPFSYIGKAPKRFVLRAAAVG